MASDELDIEDEFDKLEADDQKVKEVASAQEKFRREKVRDRFFEPEFDFEEKFRAACARVQFMKSRQKKFYVEGDREWDFPKTAKKNLSKFEYHRKLRKKAIESADKALHAGKMDEWRKHEKVVDQETAICLLASHNIGGYYNAFRNGVH